jgi:hypothetical protein
MDGDNDNILASHSTDITLTIVLPDRKGHCAHCVQSVDQAKINFASCASKLKGKGQSTHCSRQGLPELRDSYLVYSAYS